MTAAPTLRLLTYVFLAGCVVSWGYAAWYAYIFEWEMTGVYRARAATRTLVPGMGVFAPDLPARCRGHRRKALCGLGVFFALAACLAVILYLRAH